MSTFNCFTCELCDKTFSKRFNLKRHYNNIHSGYSGTDQESSRTTALKCAICVNTFKKFTDFSDHLPRVHDIELQTNELEFENSSHFKEWKKSVEEQETASYVKNRSGSTYADKKIVYYQCHRSGNYRSKVSSPGKRQREIKVQGS